MSMLPQCETLVIISCSAAWLERATWGGGDDLHPISGIFLLYMIIEHIH